MSACMSGTRGSGVLSSTGDVLVRGVGGVCDMCMCLARGGVGGEGGEWMRELDLGFTNPLGTGGVLDMCLCFGCGGVGGVGGEWVGGLDRGWERWGNTMHHYMLSDLSFTESCIFLKIFLNVLNTKWSRDRRSFSISVACIFSIALICDLFRRPLHTVVPYSTR